ncbi:shikimate dehydrogenase [Helicobacter sp. 11S02596-1]|uniref:shikimate dehydrogenase n=1 Tax=Helicobacter sp. 11S02596-1 TaxID=1476194 RepID=UPI000BA795D7|nr:shikimate dehydrogenase [Helicobacter sp. 11S02596-1]PAF43132.1 shikimate dehydrogenase [Helicobacter sp. 11S02596-1]
MKQSCRQFCVFGNPIGHSKSPLIHNFAFHSLASEMDFFGFYGRVLLQDGKALRQSFFDLGLSGANVTVPFKEDAYLQSDEVRGIAKAIGSVNTLVLEGSHLVGYNTDAEGFYQTIASHGFSNALIIGAGGSAKALAYILKNQGINTSLINRTKERLESFIQAGFECYSYEAFSSKGLQKGFDLIINATPAGLTDDSLPMPKDLLVKIFEHSKMAYDLIYGITTPFLKLAKELGIPAQDGKDMLIYQAALAFALFCGERIDPIAIAKKMKSIL